MKDKKSKYDDYVNELPFQNENGASRGILSKLDFELFDDTLAVVHPVVRIKRSNSTTRGEKWRIFLGEELKFLIDGDKLSKKERTFLRTVDGINWLIKEFKVGFKSLNELKIKLKTKLN